MDFQVAVHGEGRRSRFTSMAHHQSRAINEWTTQSENLLKPRAGSSAMPLSFSEWTMRKDNCWPPALNSPARSRRNEKLKTSQPRVAEIEQAASDVSLDQIVRAYGAVGGTVTFSIAAPSSVNLRRKKN